MKVTFADTGYWMAVFSPGDDLHAEALKAKERLGNVILVTTDEVLVEFLNYFSGKGSKLRELAARMVRSMLDDPNVRVHQQTRESPGPRCRSSQSAGRVPGVNLTSPGFVGKW